MSEFENDKISIGTVVFLYDRNSPHRFERNAQRFEYFVVVSISPRFLLFPVKKELHSFILESSELILNQMELRDDILNGYWIDCTNIVAGFRLEEIIKLTRERRNVVIGQLQPVETSLLKTTIKNSATLEKEIIKELLSGLEKF